MSLKHKDLINTILPIISIDEFEPKAGKTAEVIVVAFYLDEKDPADDLNTFIQRGSIDTIDVDVSPNTDDDGKYLVFVEMNRDSSFPSKFSALIKDIENISGKLDWKVRTYLSDEKEFTLDDPKLYKFIITVPEEYVTKDEFVKESMHNKVRKFLQDSAIVGLTFSGNHVILSASGRQIIAEVVDVGEYDAVFRRNLLTESAFKLLDKPIEATVLGGILGEYIVMPINKLLCVENKRTNSIMLLNNVEIRYRS